MEKLRGSKFEERKLYYKSFTKLDYLLLVKFNRHLDLFRVTVNISNCALRILKGEKHPQIKLNHSQKL